MIKKYYNFTILLSVIVLALMSCNRHLNKTKGAKELLIFPSPPDTTRIQFLTSINSSTDVTGGRSAFKRFVLGEEKVRLVSKPYGIEIKNGKIYICDTGFDGLEIIDLEKNRFDYFLPSGKGQLKQPINSFVDSYENLYVADADRGQIVVFDKNGKYVNAFGEQDDFKPTDVFIYEDKIFVANIKGHKVHVYQNEGTYKLLYSFPDLGEDDEGFLNQPSNLFVDKDKVYVTDAGNFKIKKYSHKGEYIESVGSHGKRAGQFSRPKGIAVDKELNLYAVDASFENVQIFNKKGQILMPFGGPYTGKGFMYLPAGITIDYDNLKYFEKFVDESFGLKYLIFVTNQYGPEKITVYGAVQ